MDLLTGRPNNKLLHVVTDHAKDLQEKLERVHNFARDNLKLKTDKMKEYNYDASSQDETLNEGDSVWLYNPTRKKGLSPKLMRPWPQGSYVIVKKINDFVYRIQRSASLKWCIRTDCGDTLVIMRPIGIPGVPVTAKLKWILLERI